MNLFGFPVRKKCLRCGEAKPIEEFARHKSKPLGRQDWCKGCWSQYHASRRVDTPQGVRA